MTLTLLRPTDPSLAEVMPLRLPPVDIRLAATGRDPVRVSVAVANSQTAASLALLGAHLARRSGGLVTLIEVRDSRDRWAPYDTGGPRLAAVDVAYDALSEESLDSDIQTVWSPLGSNPDRRRRQIARAIAAESLKSAATIIVVGAGMGGFGGFDAGVAGHLRQLTRAQVVEVPVGYSVGTVADAQSLAWI